MKTVALISGVLVLTCAFLLAQNPVSDKDSTAPRSQNNQGQSVGGKTHTGHPERQVTTTGSVGQNTPGAETEAGVEQAPGGNSDVPHTGPSNPNANNKSKTIQPPNPNDPGQTAHEADVNAQAASRAEIQPGTTLGVNANSNTAANAGSASQAKANLPQSDAASSGAKKAPAKKGAQPNKKKASTQSESKPQ